MQVVTELPEENDPTVYKAGVMSHMVFSPSQQSSSNREQLLQNPLAKFERHRSMGFTEQDCNQVGSGESDPKPTSSKTLSIHMVNTEKPTRERLYSDVNMINNNKYF